MDALYTYKSNWRGYVLKRLPLAVISFFIFSLVLFTFIHGLWGIDHTIIMAGRVAHYEELPVLEKIIKQPSDELRITKYLRWMGEFFTGEWGESILGASNYLR